MDEKNIPWLRRPVERKIAVDIGTLLRLKQMWNTFSGNHPKFPDFIRDVKNKGFSEGTELTFTVSYPDGQTMRAGLRLKDSDIVLIQELMSKGNGRI